MATLSMDELVGSAGTDLGSASWIEITQDRIDAFGRATNDWQWLHVDPERARTGPFGTTIAHGYLTLSLVSAWLFELLEVDGAASTINYGVNRARFPAPVPVGSRLRARGEIVEASGERDWVQLVVRVTVDIEGGIRPVCVADIVIRYLSSEETIA